MTAAPHIVGVRHHSPACAALVQERIRALQPAHVLIEGPCDFNDRLDQLLLGHQLPIAIFSYYHHEGRSRASWSPLCDYSPEWVAVQEGHRAGAAVRFIDLPAWSLGLRGRTNRYADRRRRLGYVTSLCKRLGIEGLDALWDHLFEQPMPTEVLRARLQTYFERVRASADGAAFAHEAPREQHMAAHVAHAMQKGDGPVLVVCGGYHAPALAERWRSFEGCSAPPTPRPADRARHGSYLVPYSFRRLDAFAGYEAGMPSPAYYQQVWERGPREAGERMLEDAVRQLRERGQAVSASDLIAAETMTRGLMRLRGHESVARVDLLDGVAAALLKEALDAPLPWTRRGPLRPGTHPALVVVLEALSGVRRGQLDPATPRPPLLADVAAALREYDLEPVEGETRERSLDLTAPRELAASRVLHRLRVLRVPGFERLRGPAVAIDAELSETWSIAAALDSDSSLIEAAAFGATLEAAASARLEEAMRGVDGNLDGLAAVLTEAVFVGLDGLTAQVFARASEQVEREARLAPLGRALALVLALWRHGRRLSATGAEPLGGLMRTLVRRGLWLFEGRSGAAASTPTDELRAVIALRDAARYAGHALTLDAEIADGVMRRRAVDLDAPAALRGAALGYLWSMRRFEDQATAEQHAARALRRGCRPALVGELLSGLFALAREEVIGAAPLVSALDAVLAGQSSEDFLVAVPSLRLAFAWFPPRERDAIAKRVLELRGESQAAASTLRSLEVTPGTRRRAFEMERRIDAVEARYGLEP